MLGNLFFQVALGFGSEQHETSFGGAFTAGLFDIKCLSISKK